MGEGFGAWAMGDDDALLEVVTSANVACGFHAGDPSIMRRTCERAVAAGVGIGAHVGYRDLAGFGRRELAAEAAVLADEAAYQLGALQACAAAAGGTVRHVKPHGALYHRCSRDEDAAEAVVGALRAVDPGLRIVGAPGSALLRRAEAAGLVAVPEGFADRGYAPDGSLLPRSQPGALLANDEALAQAVELAAGGGSPGRDLDVGTICVHGDSPGAVALARAVREALEAAGVTVEPFA